MMAESKSGVNVEGPVHLLTHIRKSKGLSERALAESTGLSRETLRSAEREIGLAKPRHLDVIAAALGRRILLGVIPAEPALSDLSTISVSLAVVADGFESWKIHFMDLVDQFRRDHDIRLLLLPPSSRLDARLTALLASIAATLCAEVGLEPPDWSAAVHFLAKPWFVSGIESLKASALVESPVAFRRNNIFVHANFLERL